MLLLTNDQPYHLGMLGVPGLEKLNLAAGPKHKSIVGKLDVALKKWMDSENDIGDPRSVKWRK